jgi:hypothetical protein
LKIEQGVLKHGTINTRGEWDCEGRISLRARTLYTIILAGFLGVVLSLAPLLPFFTRSLELSEVQTLREFVEQNEVEYRAETTLPLLPVLVIGLVGCTVGASIFYYAKRRLLSTER